jgi:hypothetical protein
MLDGKAAAEQIKASGTRLGYDILVDWSLWELLMVELAKLAYPFHTLRACQLPAK